MKPENLERLLEKEKKLDIILSKKIYIIDFFSKTRMDFFTGYILDFKMEGKIMDICRLQPYIGFYVQHRSSYGYIREGVEANYCHLMLDKTNIITTSFLTHQKQTRKIINEKLRHITQQDFYKKPHKIELAMETIKEFKKYLEVSKQI